MVVAAVEGGGEVPACLLHAGDLGVEKLEAVRGDRLPLSDVGGVENPFDVVERQPGVLEHADEDQPAKRFGAEAALA
jgi:hypothetical protein